MHRHAQFEYGSCRRATPAMGGGKAPALTKPAAPETSGNKPTQHGIGAIAKSGLI
jgi:hypothetical protein